MFNRQQVATLKEFESYFHSALYADYVRNMPTNKLALIKALYEQVSGEKVTGKLSCGVCQLNFFKKVAKLYYESRDQIALQDESGIKDAELPETPAEPTPEDIKKQKARENLAKARAAKKAKTKKDI